MFSEISEHHIVWCLNNKLIRFTPTIHFCFRYSDKLIGFTERRYKKKEKQALIEQIPSDDPVSGDEEKNRR